MKIRRVVESFEQEQGDRVLRVRHSGGRAPQRRIPLFGHNGARAVQPFAKTIIAFVLLRREMTGKRGVYGERLSLKMRLRQPDWPVKSAS